MLVPVLAEEGGVPFIYDRSAFALGGSILQTLPPTKNQELISIDTAADGAAARPGPSAATVEVGGAPDFLQFDAAGASAEVRCICSG
jgi:hypothetical protein